MTDDTVTHDTATPAIDAIDLEVIKASLGGIVQEMQNSLFRTGFSTIVRESQDASCALMNESGEVVAQHVVLPLHIGAFPACCAAVLEAFSDAIAEGDAFLINHPYQGGSPHAPDMAVITPVFIGGRLFGFCGSIAHKSDIGGPVPGSCSGQAREIFNEGLQIPAVRYQSGHVPNGDLERIIAANSRTPELVLGDIRGQLGADRLGERRLVELVAKHGASKIRACYDRLFEMARARVRLAVAGWKDGQYQAERFVDDDGIELERPVRIHVMVDKRGDALHFDFTASADQTKGPANIRPPLVQAACAMPHLADRPALYVAAGCCRAFPSGREGSVLNPRFRRRSTPTIRPSALVDAIFAALSHVVPAGARRRQRQPVHHSRRPQPPHGPQLRPVRDRGGRAGPRHQGRPSGITVSRQRADRAGRDRRINSDRPAFTSFPDSVAPANRGGLGLRREYLNLEDARFPSAP